MGQSKHFHVQGQNVVIAGGSKGLGRELAILLTQQGAHVTILARSPGPLEETRQELLSHTQSADQVIQAESLDLTDPTKVQAFITSLPTPPTILLIVAGGVAAQVGFFASLTPQEIKDCMDANYFAAAYIAHACLRRWVKEPPFPPAANAKRHLIFTASTAAFLGLPGYGAYAPAKAAMRALADTLRAEALLYRAQQEIRVHCAFPGTIYTDAFYQEQIRKPKLLKELEGSAEDQGGLPARRIAELMLQGLQAGRFFVTMDGETELLMNNMRGPSPRDRPIRDWVMGLVASLVWPVYRWKFDRRTVEYGRGEMTSQEGGKE
ncbi:putative steroid dehydrogenase [Aspergillus saccharolyticus JOP 1030-1]|uniref:Putative steroid dehydrogenase n=1 Tax=Aspergillus saccharolyticus JOP 1030-1 TaxID=1450539 RepID=A0A318ZNG4_9EURO|nr:putative steroid dehydrogenase [Aspergillus saccharolyticus JOP 1030-1]PYH45983.1 putative steroid dehydrogenase [Aspergillus saccharolyticus JOP 1030-1]